MNAFKYIALFALIATGSANICVPECSGPEDYYPNLQDCSKYFQCAGGVAVPRNCPDGLEWNPTLQVCDFPQSAGCTADPNLDCSGTTAAPVVTTAAPVVTTEAPVVTTKAPVVTTDAPVVTTAAPVATTESVVPTTAAGECIPECPADWAIYANPRACESFFLCFNGEPHFFECPFGLFYNPERHFCDLPQNVDCTAGPDAPCVAV